ncbi:MAG: SusD/RagB family nutrient-binding outer membrane lipoprotein [Bacteroidetes bacterium]|nr:SusD/RagB family nutrient-binding outer membrane lipoprotein [Bacteroidota bacterium]
MCTSRLGGDSGPWGIRDGALFRRSGFPRLTKNPYPGSEIKGNFINRIPYPDSEIITNLGNMNEAVKNQGPNDLNSKVWWDSK